MPNRYSDAENIVGMELRVVDDVIPVRFGTREEIPPEVIFHAGAGMKQEMCTVSVDLTTIHWAQAEFVVEENGLATNTGHEVATNLFIKTRRIDCIHVIKKRSVGLKIVVNGFLVAEG